MWKKIVKIFCRPETTAAAPARPRRLIQPELPF